MWAEKHLFEDNLSIGMSVKASGDDYENTDNVFDHNHYKDFIRISYNGQEGVQLGGGTASILCATRAVVEHCLFDNVSADAEIISDKSSHNTLRYNTFRNCKAGLVLRSGRSCVVEGNFFFIKEAGGKKEKSLCRGVFKISVFR